MKQWATFTVAVGTGAAAYLSYLYLSGGRQRANGDGESGTEFTSDRCAVRETDGAGRAVFALHRLAAGTVLFSEVPLKAASIGEMVDVADACGALDVLCGGDSLLARVNLNHFVAADGSILLHRHVSMLNHSCSPNASIKFQGGPTEPTTRIVLARDVAAGEEINVCYSAQVLFARQPERQGELQARWGFACTCARCSGTLHAGDVKMWQACEDAAQSAKEAKPRCRAPHPSIHTKQTQALALLERELPYLCEREQFRADEKYFE